MGRRSLRAERRVEIARAFVRVLGTHGQGGATIAAVATEAGIAPGLVHHYFADKQDLYEAVTAGLLADFRRRVEATEGADGLDAYVDAALALDERSDVSAARAWVGVFAEALGDPVLFAKVRRLLDSEIAHLERLSRGRLDARGASAVLTFVIGALVFGGFAPRKTAGFAAPALRNVLRALMRS
jgi:TetR/AcrR family transcriptional repressor of bet genes